MISPTKLGAEGAGIRLFSKRGFSCTYWEFALGEGLGLGKSNGLDCAQPGNFALFIHVKNRSKFRVAHMPLLNNPSLFDITR